MAIRRVRILLLIVVFWVLASWYYRSTDSTTGLFNSFTGPSKVNGDYRWEKHAARYPVGQLTQLPTNKPARPIPPIQATKPQEDAVAKEERLARLAAVKDSFRHSWEGYKGHAWAHDEIKPISGEFKDPFGGWAATLVDSLDTLWLMGLKDDFEMAVAACDKIDFSTTKSRDINVFETTIRYLGGFLAAYELSDQQYPTLLNKSTEIASLLMTAFDTPNHMPIARFNWRDYVRGRSQRASVTTLLAEIGSLSLEFTKMSQITGDMQYYDAVQRIYDEMENAQATTRLPGMWPVVVDASTTPMDFDGDGFTLGGMSDSAFEYLPKQYLLLGGAIEQPRKMYEMFIDPAKKHLSRRALHPGNHPVAFFGDAHISKTTEGEKMVVTTPRAQHLTCFTGGMVGLGGKIFDRPKDLEFAAELTDGCTWSYSATASGIGPEIFFFIPCDPNDRTDDCQWSEDRWVKSLGKHWVVNPNKEEGVDVQKKVTEIIDSRRLPKGMVDVSDRRYILRPEAIESVFYMYRFTGDAKYMEVAWNMFVAIEKATRSTYASAALHDVTYRKPDQVDSMESFWLAETLKYFYLIFGEWDAFDLDKWVLNTEAHPLRRADA
ncbi:glycoside hydrolase [Xylariaceae sp. FL1019]|nr:glycoside hydrolase [Xylariaceae sp. FL1019]